MKKLLVLILLLCVCVTAAGEEYEVWVLCQPDSYINIRESPSKNSKVGGYAFCGDRFTTNEETKNGYMLVYAPIEQGYGWIKKGYLVFSEPREVNVETYIAAKGRVNARKTIDGKRRMWLKPGDDIFVYWASDWAVTNKGFVKTEYIEGFGN